MLRLFTSSLIANQGQEGQPKHSPPQTLGQRKALRQFSLEKGNGVRQSWSRPESHVSDGGQSLTIPVSTLSVKLCFLENKQLVPRCVIRTVPDPYLVKPWRKSCSCSHSALEHGI